MTEFKGTSDEATECHGIPVLYLLYIRKEKITIFRYCANGRVVVILQR